MNALAASAGSAGSVLSWLAAGFALLPLLIALANLRGGAKGFRRPRTEPPAGTTVSILIPARNEEAHIQAAVQAALTSVGVAVEVVVLDDQSSDRTAAIVARLADGDARVRLVRAPELPAGWTGKQHACARLAEAARHDVLMFIDADVVVAPAAAAKAAGLLFAEPTTGLVSGFPCQRTGSIGERLVVPWIHVLLLGYLPMASMRASRQPAFGAGCGQWMVARRSAYEAVGGHGAKPLSRHDGLSLPRSFRAAGWQSDIFDGTELATCRMYTGLSQVWEGFGKNADEGMASPRALPVWTLLIAFGHILPWVVLVFGLAFAAPGVVVPGAIGVGANLLMRLLLALRLRQSLLGACLHPVGAAMVLAIQWQAFWRQLRGAPSRWKGRAYLPARANPP